MSGMDLDQLRGRWQQQSRRIDATLSLDIERVRARLQMRTQSAFQRHTRWLLLALGFGAATLLALGLFTFTNRQDVAYLLASVPLLGLVLAEFVTDFRQWRTLARLDSSQPIIEVRATLQALRTRRLRMVRWILLSCVLLWLPALAVLLKGLFGIDLLRGLHFSVILANLLLGFACIPFGILLMRWLGERLSGAPAWQRMLDDASGSSFSAAQNHFESQLGFEAQLAQSPDTRSLLEQMDASWPAPTVALLRSLQRRVLASVFCYATLILLLGNFNVEHGGQPQFLVPGLLLHFVALAQMIASIVDRVLLVQIGPGQVLDVQSQLLTLRRIAHWRVKLAQITIIALPLALLAAFQVLPEVLWRVDWLGAASAQLHVALAIVTAFSCAGLALQMRRRPDTSRLLDVLSFGVLAKNRALRQQLEHHLRSK